MKTLLILAALLGSTASFANWNDTMIQGDKILFQNDSTYVSAAYNKTLCVNAGQFEATVTKCTAVKKGSGDKSDECIAYGQFFITQPVASTAERCAESVKNSSGNDICVRSVTVPFVQSAIRNVKFVNDSGAVLKSYQVTIPACQSAK